MGARVEFQGTCGSDGKVNPHEPFSRPRRGYPGFGTRPMFRDKRKLAPTSLALACTNSVHYSSGGISVLWARLGFGWPASRRHGRRNRSLVRATRSGDEPLTIISGLIILCYLPIFGLWGEGYCTLHLDGWTRDLGGEAVCKSTSPGASEPADSTEQDKKTATLCI